MAGRFRRTDEKAQRFIASRGGRAPERQRDTQRAFKYRLRREIVLALAERPHRPFSPKELSVLLAEPQMKVAYHFRVLADLGALLLVGMERAASPAGSELFYELKPEWLRSRQVRFAVRWRALLRRSQIFGGRPRRWLEG